MSEISKKVLCVDDDPNVLDGLRRQLRHDYDLTTATDPDEVLDTLERDGPFAVVLADYGMPGMDGVTFLKKVRDRSPQTVPVILAGSADLEVAVSAVHEAHIFRFLRKPCDREVIRQTLDAALEQYRLVMSERMLNAKLAGAVEQLRILSVDLEMRVQHRTATIQQLYDFVSKLNGLGTLEEVSQLVVRRTANMMRSRRVSLMLPDASRQTLSIAAAVGIDEELCNRIRVPVGEPIAGQVFSNGQGIVTQDAATVLNRPERHESEFFASMPLVSTSLNTPIGSVGVLNVTDPIGNSTYDQETLAHLKLIADAAAIAVLNQIRLAERNEARDATILALAKLAENRDPDTGAHLERVQSYCRLLAGTLAETDKYANVIDHRFIDALVHSSPLHDIGKVGIPDQILLKPGKLDDDEFETMKRHTVIGGNTIRTIIEQGRDQPFLKMGMDIAFSHHEKYDGTGYPDGLKGDAIPLAARILAVADVYDALTTKRVYKPPIPHDQSVAIIRDESGSHFDPDVVEAFNQREAEFRQLALELSDDGHAVTGQQHPDGQGHTVEPATMV